MVESTPTKAMLSAKPIARPAAHLALRRATAGASNRPASRTRRSLSSSATQGRGWPASKKLALSGELLSEASVRDAGLFDAPAVARLSAKCAAGRAIGFADNMAFVGVLSTMLLHGQFVRPATPALELA